MKALRIMANWRRTSDFYKISNILPFISQLNADDIIAYYDIIYCIRYSCVLVTPFPRLIYPLIKTVINWITDTQSAGLLEC